MPNGASAAETQEDLTLRLWEGDDSVKAELIVQYTFRLETAISRSYPTLSAQDVEDVVAEANIRFWVWREKYDPKQSKIYSRLYWLADKVASELRSGRLKWQRQRIKEKGIDADFFERIEDESTADETSDDSDAESTEELRMLKQCFDSLPELQKDILHAYADAGQYELDAGVLGKDLGDKHKDGVPIPAGTIRTNKSRGWSLMDACMKKKGFEHTVTRLRNG
jgi:RNA polymerase sigma factor (sigma-70 family)